MLVVSQIGLSSTKERIFLFLSMLRGLRVLRVGTRAFAGEDASLPASCGGGSKSWRIIRIIHVS